jgi:RNA polymerase sigma-70 factor, ECF subfamily
MRNSAGAAGAFEVMDREKSGHSLPVRASFREVASRAEEPIAESHVTVEVGDGRPASGEIATFEHIYQQYFDFVWRSARRLGVSESAVDDVVQDVFLVVHRRLRDFEGRSSMKTWVFGITLRVVSDHRRTIRRKGGLSPLPDDEVLGDRGEGPVAVLEKRQAARVLHALLEELDDEKRTVFVLAELEELGAKEIAEMVSIPVNTVYSRLRAAREAFDGALARYRAKERGGLDRARVKERP